MRLTHHAATMLAALLLAIPLHVVAEAQVMSPNPPEPPETPEVETPEVAPAAPREVVAEEPAGLTLPDGRVMLNFQNAALDAVLAFLSEASGLTVVSNLSLTGRVNLISRQPMTLDEALLVLNSALTQQGYTSVRVGKTLKIMPLDAAKQANIPVRSGNDPTVVEQSDEVITQVIPVRFANAVQLKTDLAALVPTYASLAANASTNTLILTDTSANVRRMMQIISALDTAVSAVTQVKVFTLKYANAGNAARLITEIFQPVAPAQPQQPGVAQLLARFGRFGGGPGGPGGQPAASGGAVDASGEGRPQTKVVASADDRTNTVVVSAPFDTMPIIEEVLKELDANPAQDQAVFIYYLRNAQAVNLESVVNSLFNASATRGTTTGTRTRSQSTTTPRTGTGTATGTGMGLSQIGVGGTRTTQQTSTTPRTTTAGQRVSPGAAQTAADLAGAVSVVADPDTNALLVMTASGNFERVKAVLDELDQAVRQVLIKVLVAEVTHDRDVDLGVEFSAINLRTSGKTSVFTDFGVAAATGGLVTRIVEPDINVAIRALEKVGKLDVLSRPYILTSDNRQASIIVGQEVPIISNSRITDTGQTINTLLYREVGIILYVTPHVNPDGLVVMDVIPEISALTGETVPISDTASQPVIAKRAAQTRVAIQDGQTIVIGGLMEDRKTQTQSKVPLVGDIPLIGLLFQRNETKKTKTELLIFLTPHVAEAQQRLKEISDQETEAVKIVPRAVEEGMYEHHMEGMRRGGARETEPAP